jgi:hypothetical protein
VPCNIVECLGMQSSALKCSRVPWNAAECHKYIIVICTIAYINIVFVHDINTMFVNNTAMLSSCQVSELPPQFIMPSSWQVSELPPQVFQ